MTTPVRTRRELLLELLRSGPSQAFSLERFYAKREGLPDSTFPSFERLAESDLVATAVGTPDLPPPARRS